MGENTIDNLSIELTANADQVAKVFDRLASSAGKLKGAASGAAGGMNDLSQSAKDAGTATRQAGEQTGQVEQKIRGAGNAAKDAANGVGAFWNAIRNISKSGGTVGGTLKAIFIAPIQAGIGALRNFLGGMLRIAKFRIFRAIIKDMAQSFKDLYGWSDAHGTKFADSVDKITTAFRYLRNSIAAMVAPLVNALAPALDFVVDKIVEVLNWFNQLFAALTGQESYTVAKKVFVSYADTLDSTGKKAKKTADEIKRTILGFDEINKLVSPKDKSSSSSTGSSPYTEGYKNMFEQRKVSEGFKGFSNAIESSLKSSLSRIGLIVSGAALAVGAILTFSGTNLPLGLALMAAGASGLATTIMTNWSGLDPKIKRTVAIIEGVVGGAFLALGAILAFSGTNVPLGIALMAAGGATLAASAPLLWGTLNTSIKGALSTLTLTVSGALLGIGAALALTGISVPLGLAMIAAGAVGLVAYGALNWGSLKTSVGGALSALVGVVSAAALGIGAVLAFSGIAVPMGIALMAAGAVGIVATSPLSWGSLKTSVSGSLSMLTTTVSGALLAVGAILALTGIATPLGIGMMAIGAVGLATSKALNWGSMNTSVSGALSTLFNTVSAPLLVIGFILTLTGASIPLGIGLIAAGAVGLAKSKPEDWNVLDNKIKSPLQRVVSTIAKASLVLGIIALVGGAVPLGIGLIIAGATGLFGEGSENWGNLVNFGKTAIDKVKEGWETAKTFVVDVVVKIAGKVWDGVSTLLDLLTTGGVSGESKDPYYQDSNNQYTQGWADKNLGRSFGSAKGGGGSAASVLPMLDPGPVVDGVGRIKNAMNDLSGSVSMTRKNVYGSMGGMVTDTETSMNGFVNNIETGKNNAAKVDFTPIGENVPKTIRNGMGQMWWEATSKMNSLMDDLYNKGNSKSFEPIGSNIISGISAGLSNGWDWLTNKVKRLSNGLFNAAKNVLGIHSPSKVFEEGIGKMIDLGIAQGIDNSAEAAMASVSRLGGMLTGELYSFNPQAAVAATMDYGGDGGANQQEQVTLMRSMLNEMRTMVNEMRQLNEKDNSIEITTSQYTRAQKRSNMRAGVAVVPIG